MKTILTLGIAIIIIGAIILDTTILQATGIISIIIGTFLLIAAPLISDFLNEDKNK